ncbi:MAG: DUF1570 domain-containing protein [Pirellulaceae bacterium]
MLCLEDAWHARPVAAVEHVSVRHDGRELDLAGRVLVEAQDGGLLLETASGALWIVQPEALVRRATDAAAFQPLGPEEVGQQLLAELPPGFKVHRTANYVICYNTSTAYAEWCGSLYERLYRGYYSYWKNRGLGLHKPVFPLVALVFESKASYARYAEKELGDATHSIIGYYNMQTNRVTMYDLTGIDGLRKTQRGVSSAAHINQVLSQPAAERTVATIVHEATHQLAYNTGLQTRFAGNPMWVSEGIAVYFETPDLGSSRGWRSVGAINRRHLNRFHEMLVQRPPDGLKILVTDDARFRDPQTSADAYAAAWAFNYYLLRAKSPQYVNYLQQMAQLPPLAEQTSEERIAQLEQALGADLAHIDEEFIRYMRRVR